MPFSAMEYKVPKPKGDKYPRELHTIGDHLRKRRMDLGLLQKDVAEIIGTRSVESITNWENGHSEPQIHYLPSVIKLLGYIPVKVYLDTFGGQVRAFRILNGLSHKAMGSKVGVDASTVSSWENNVFLPHRSKLDELKKLMELTFSVYAEILK